MRRVPSEASAAERARWLGEMAEALIEAQHLAWHIGLASANPEAMELYGRIEAAFSEVQALRLGRRQLAPNEHAPKWTDTVPWSTAPDAPRC